MNRVINRDFLVLKASLLMAFTSLTVPGAVVAAPSIPALPATTPDQSRSSDPSPHVITDPVLAIAEKDPVKAGSPIRLHLSLRNTTKKAFYYSVTGKLSDWQFAVDWLGVDGRQPFHPVPRTPQGEKDLTPSMIALAMDANLRMDPGQSTEGPVVIINDLFEMKRPGVYLIHVSRTVSPRAVWTTRKTFTSPGVLLRVQ